MTVSGSQLPSPGPVTEDALSDCGVGSSGVRVGTGWTLVGAVSGGKGVSMQPLPVCCWGEMPGWGQQSPGSPTCLPAPTLLCPPCAVGRDAFCRCRQEELRALSSGQLGLHWSLSLCPYLCQGACSLHPQAPREWPVLQRSPGATPQLKFGYCLQQPPRTELSLPPLSAHPTALPNAAFSIPRLARTEWGPRGPRSEDWAGPGGLGQGQWPQPGGRSLSICRALGRLGGCVVPGSFWPCPLVQRWG